MKSDREIIFKNIRKSLSDSKIVVGKEDELDKIIERGIKSITPNTSKNILSQFKDELEKVNGEFYFVNNKDELLHLLQKLLSENNVKSLAVSGENEISEIAGKLNNINIIKAIEYSYRERKEKISNIDVALVKAGNGIADIGSVVFYYDDSLTTYPHFLCDWTIIIIYKKTILPNQFELFKNIETEKSKNMVLVTGPSRTADIEKTLVLGAHGPRRVSVVVIE